MRPNRIRLVLAVSLLCPALAAQSPDQPVRRPGDPGVITTRQAITPAGVQSVFDGRVYGVAFGADPGTVWVLTTRRVFELGWAENAVRQTFETGLAPGLQGLQVDVASGAVVVAGTNRSREPGLPPQIRVASVGPRDAHPDDAPPGLQWLADRLGAHLAGAVAVARETRADGRRVAVVPLVFDNAVAVLDLARREVVGTVKGGVAPFGAAIDDGGTTAWISNWGGRIPREGEPSATMGESKGADRVVVDRRGVSASGTVSRVDLNTLRLTDTVEVGLHPTALAWDERHGRLYVADSNDDSVSIIDTSARRVLGRIDLEPFGPDVQGISPTALALAPDAGRLYVACGGINAVAVVSVADQAILGYVPTAWYPDSLALSPDGRFLAIGALLGEGSGWRRDATPSYTLGLPDPARRYVHAARGSISVLPVPGDRELVSGTLAVAENNRLPIAEPAARRGGAAPSAKPAPPRAVPLAAGDPSLIEHVVYVIKENRTYDQLFGDLPGGNGDPSLVLFGQEVAPNQRRLAREFVLLDNFYATGGNSGDGHQWVTQANETAYAMWPGYTGRSYPYDGSDPLAYAKGGFIWDAASEKGRTVRIYGEYMPSQVGVPPAARAGLLAEWQKGVDFSRRWAPTPRVEGMKRFVAPDFPAYSTAIPDVVRARLFLRDLQAWNQAGVMPHLVLVQLPSDHTYGTSAGRSTPKAMVADNDLALGQIVEGLTRSRFWPRMAILVVEDDAQDGVDHVDGHRTLALAISPYTRRRTTDSTFYSQPSLLKTIELMLGLQPLSIFDRIANDLGPSFTDEPDLTPYAAVVPRQSLFEVNPPAASLAGPALAAALASARMPFDNPDAAPAGELNRILWHSIRGWDTPYPGVRRAAFAPLAADEDDEEAGSGRRR